MRRPSKFGLAFLLLSMAVAHLCPAQTPVPVGSGFDAELAGFTIQTRGFQSQYRILGVYVLPEDKLQVVITESNRTGAYELTSKSGATERKADYDWIWHAPKKPGLCRLVIRRDEPADSMLLNVFVMVPAGEVRGGYLRGYHLGDYPKEAYKGLEIYTPPEGFIEVTPANGHTLLSPHFRLEQFVCKQEGGFPKYVVLREELLLKLELILQRANEMGVRCSSFVVLSGYRTPYYNESIGNVKYSRHLWGGAADIFVDEHPGDGIMDDLNGDGTINWKDAAVLYDIIDELYGKPVYEPFIGGLARYRKTAHHGPFVHVDVRGFRARWGD